MSTIEYTRLLQEVKKEENLRNITIVYMLLHTGIRVSELCRLNRSNVDLIKNILIVQKDEEECVIPLSQKLREHLRNYLNFRSLEEAIFISSSGKLLTNDDLK